MIRIRPSHGCLLRDDAEEQQCLVVLPGERVSHSEVIHRMRKRFLGFTFERESYWLAVLYVLIPLLGILLLIVIPGLWRRWFP